MIHNNSACLAVSAGGGAARETAIRQPKAQIRIIGTWDAPPHSHTHPEKSGKGEAHALRSVVVVSLLLLLCGGAPW